MCLFTIFECMASNDLVDRSYFKQPVISTIKIQDSIMAETMRSMFETLWDSLSD